MSEQLKELLQNLREGVPVDVDELELAIIADGNRKMRQCLYNYKRLHIITE